MQRGERAGRIVVVAVDDEGEIGGDEALGRGYGVGGATRLGLFGKVDGEARGRRDRLVVAPNLAVLGANDEAGATVAGVGASWR